MTTLYKKEIRGKSVRYIPFKEYDEALVSSLPEGYHLVCVTPGFRSTLHNVNPDYASLLAVGRSKALDVLVEALLSASELHPRKPLTDVQMEAYNRFVDTMPEDKYYLEYNSYYNIAEAGLNALIDEARKLKEK